MKKVFPIILALILTSCGAAQRISKLAEKNDVLATAGVQGSKNASWDILNPKYFVNSDQIGRQGYSDDKGCLQMHQNKETGVAAYFYTSTWESNILVIVNTKLRIAYFPKMYTYKSFYPVRYQGAGSCRIAAAMASSDDGEWYYIDNELNKSFELMPVTEEKIDCKEIRYAIHAYKNWSWLSRKRIFTPITPIVQKELFSGAVNVRVQDIMELLSTKEKSKIEIISTIAENSEKQIAQLSDEYERNKKLNEIEMAKERAVRDAREKKSEADREAKRLASLSPSDKTNEALDKIITIGKVFLIRSQCGQGLASCQGFTEAHNTKINCVNCDGEFFLNGVTYTSSSGTIIRLAGTIKGLSTTATGNNLFMTTPGGCSLEWQKKNSTYSITSAKVSSGTPSEFSSPMWVDKIWHAYTGDAWSFTNEICNPKSAYRLVKGKKK